MPLLRFLFHARRLLLRDLLPRLNGVVCKQYGSAEPIPGMRKKEINKWWTKGNVPREGGRQANDTLVWGGAGIVPNRVGFVKSCLYEIQ